MTRSTRRGFLGGAAAGVALPVLTHATDAAAAPAIVQARRQTVHRGRAIAVSPRGSTVLVGHDRRRTVAITRGTTTRTVDVGGRPLAVAVSPDGRLGAVTTAFWDHPGLVLVDLRTATVLHRLDVGPAPGRVAFTAGGAQVVVAGGEQEGRLTVVRVAQPEVVLSRPIGAVPRDLAITRDGRAAWVALSAEDRVARVDLRTGQVMRALRVPALPDRLALSPHGDRLLLTHAARDAERVSEVDLVTRRVRRHIAGPSPSAVAWTRAGRRVVALGGTDEIVVLGRRPRRRHVGAAPRDMAVAGRTVRTVSDLTDVVSAVRV